MEILLSFSTADCFFLQWGKTLTHPKKEYPRCDTKTTSDGEAPVMGIWRVLNTPFIAITSRFTLTLWGSTYRSNRSV